jgi:uncharacterized protein (DUF427 family)
MRESAWEYPRPPRLGRSTRLIEVTLGGAVIARTSRAHRVLETSHPPVYCVSREHVGEGVLEAVAGVGSVCEWNGVATDLDVLGGDGRRASRAARTYEDPTPAFAAIAGAVAFSPALMDT